jgi:sugar diacid utilization regulator
MRDRAAISDLVATVLTPLEQARDGAGPLLDTLAAYFAAGSNAARAARALHLSVRALTYRLDRVHRLTGHDPTSDASRFTLHAAVLGAKLLDWPATPLD